MIFHTFHWISLSTANPSHQWQRASRAQSLQNMRAQKQDREHRARGLALKSGLAKRQQNWLCGNRTGYAMTKPAMRWQNPLLGYATVKVAMWQQNWLCGDKTGNAATKPVTWLRGDKTGYAVTRRQWQRPWELVGTWHALIKSGKKSRLNRK